MAKTAVPKDCPTEITSAQYFLKKFDNWDEFAVEKNHFCKINNNTMDFKKSYNEKALVFPQKNNFWNKFLACMWDQLRQVEDSTKLLEVIICSDTIESTKSTQVKDKIVPEGNLSNSETYLWTRGEAEGLRN